MLIAWSETFGDNDSNFNSKHGRGGCLNPSYPTIKNLKPYSVHKIRICVRLLNKFRKVSSSIILCKYACLLDKVTQHCVSFYACALGNNERSKKEGVCRGISPRLCRSDITFNFFFHPRTFQKLFPSRFLKLPP